MEFGVDIVQVNLGSFKEQSECIYTLSFFGCYLLRIEDYFVVP